MKMNKKAFAMKKNTLYFVVLLLLVIGGIFYFVKSSSSSPSNPNPSGSGDIQKITISMKNGNYYPNTITVKANQPVEITLDSSVAGCYRGFNIRDFGISQYSKSPSDKITFTPTQTGSHRFACSMGMGTGTLIVE